jgi:gentisate 1,2-dioxygenase
VTPGASAERESYYRAIAELHLSPLWQVLHSLVLSEPSSPALAARWRYHEVRPHLLRSGELISAREAVRRVLILENPGMPGSSSITRTLYAGLQLILPGEVAPAHRHTQSAFRFVLEGEGAFTAVRGERVMMSRHDLILTPNMDWHDHGNPSDAAMIWLDGLDIPLVAALDGGFAENHEADVQDEAVPVNTNATLWGQGLRPVSVAAAPRTPCFSYPYARWRQALEAAKRSSEPSPRHAYQMEFVNPADGGCVLPTMSAFCQLVPAGFTTEPTRQTDGMVFVVVEGAGCLKLEDQSIDLQQDDIFVVPSWHLFSLAASAELVLFSYSDRAAQQKLGLWRQSRLED